MGMGSVFVVSEVRNDVATNTTIDKRNKTLKMAVPSGRTNLTTVDKVFGGLKFCEIGKMLFGIFGVAMDGETPVTTFL
jgi:hypothetical protein